MRKFLISVVIFVALVISVFYFELPLNLVRPVFHSELVNRYAEENHLDPLFVTALIKVESNFVTRARSHRGAQGLMQLMPATAQELARERGYKDPRNIDLQDTRTNIELGTFYLRKLETEFNGNNVLALAAYNAGMTKVQSWYLQNPLIAVELTDIPYPETRNYVKNVLRTYRWLKKIQAFKNLVRGKKA